jgi:hypothetical protein
MDHFATNYRARWNLSNYTDANEPTVMLGYYRPEDDIFVNNHKGPIIMHWGGNDLTKTRAIKLNNRSNTYQHGYGWFSDTLNSWDIVHKKCNIPYRSYTDFKPTPLGDKIYVYKGWLNDRGKYFLWNEVIVPLFNKLGEDRFVYGRGHTHQYIHDNFYNNCFLYIKPNERGGSTSMWELAHMGRKTIANRQGEAPNVINYQTIDDIIDIIERESVKIGTIQERVAIDTHNHFMHDDCWLNLDWWNN